MTGAVNIRPARKSDAAHMVALIDRAGYGMPLWLWSGLRQDEPSVLDVGRKRAMREEGGFSYRKANLIECGGEVAGMLIGYRLDDPYDAGDLSKLPDIFRPMVELESLVPGSWYINVISVHEDFQGRGLGRQLMEFAEVLAQQADARSLSIIFESRNDAARRLYLKMGFAELDRRPRVPYPGDYTGSEEWVLLTKPLNAEEAKE